MMKWYVYDDLSDSSGWSEPVPLVDSGDMENGEFDKKSEISETSLNQ